MKFWWKGEPIIVGSLRWRIIDNDYRQATIRCCAELNKLQNPTIGQMTDVAYKCGLTLKIELKPNK